MPKPRDHVSLETKLASALLALGHIPHSHAKLMTASQIISLYEFDHYPIRKADGGTDEPWNIRPLGIMAHREKTAKIDIPQIAKIKRSQIKEARHAVAMAAKTGQGTAHLAEALAPLADPKRARPKRKIASRGFPKVHRPLRSRNTFEGRTS